MASPQLFLQFQTAHGGHAQINDRTSGFSRICLLQKLLGRGEGFDRQAHRLEQSRQAGADRGVIIHYVNRGLCVVHRSSPGKAAG